MSVASLRSSPWRTTAVVCAAALLGVAAMKGDDCEPSFDTRGHNTECKMSYQCGWAHFSITVPCEVSLAQLQQGCFPGTVHECIFLGCYHPLWGNCSGC
jgi:hypothetical protein